MNALNMTIEPLNSPAPALSGSPTTGSTRRKLAFWGGMFVVFHVIIGFCLQHSPELKPFIPQAWWEVLAAKSIELIFLALLIPILLVRDGLTLADVGFVPARWKPDVRLGILCGAVIWFMHDSLLKLASVGSQGADINKGMLSMVETLSDAPIELCGLIFGTVIVGPLLEEIIYRGCLMSSARANLGMGPLGALVAVVSSGIIFAALHELGHPVYYAVYFVTGLAFALFYRKTGSLAAAFVAHGVVNGLFAARVGMQIWGLQ